MLKKITQSSSDSEFSLRCNACVAEYSDIVMFSAAGPVTSVKAFQAGVYDERKIEYLVDGRRGTKRPGKWKCSTHRLGQSLWHVVARLDDPRIVYNWGEAALWAYLKEQTSTPLVRDWMSWLLARLQVNDLSGFNCDARRVRFSTEDVDRLVSQGVKDGELRI